MQIVLKEYSKTREACVHLCGVPGGFTLPTRSLLTAPRLSLGPDAPLADVHLQRSLRCLGFRVLGF